MIAMKKFTLQFSGLLSGGFEKVGPLGQSLPTEDRQITTQSGHIDDLTGWEEALRNGDVTVTLSTEE